MEKYNERIDKIIASTGIMSRKEVKKAAKEQRIALNGKFVKDCGTKATDKDLLTLDGKTVNYKKFVYVMLNKPIGYVCSTDDPSSPIVNELLGTDLQRLNLFSIGRLDKNTTGLVILTNDGELTHALLSPAKHVNKKYYFNTKLPLKEEYIKIFNDGVTLEDGTLCRPALLEPLTEKSGYITICEGKFHQIKRMFDSVGNKVVALERVSIGGLTLDKSLKYADFRLLTDEEITMLKHQN